MSAPTDAAMLANWRWPNFTPDEIRCRETGQLLIVPTFMDRLQRLRTVIAKPLVITSAYRHPTHSVERGKAQPGAHTFGRAVDIAADGQLAFELLAHAPSMGFTGIGVSQRGGKPRFVHLDDLRPGEYHGPRPTVWSY